ncbi:unnamed protein product, partial [Gulo gulo]
KKKKKKKEEEELNWTYQAQHYKPLCAQPHSESKPNVLPQTSAKFRRLKILRFQSLSSPKPASHANEEDEPHLPHSDLWTAIKRVLSIPKLRSSEPTFPSGASNDIPHPGPPRIISTCFIWVFLGNSGPEPFNDHWRSYQSF